MCPLTSFVCEPSGQRAFSQVLTDGLVGAGEECDRGFPKGAYRPGG